MSKGKIGLLLGLVLLLGGFGYLVYGGLDKNLVYFLTPTELQAKGAAAYDAPVRLGGQVVPGSVDWNPTTLDLRFRMTDGKNVVEGKMQHTGVFDASNLRVKHSNEYRPPTKGHKPEEMYRSLIKDAQS